MSSEVKLKVKKKSEMVVFYYESSSFNVNLLAKIYGYAYTFDRLWAAKYGWP